MLSPIRVGEWWDSKLVPILAAFYATALMLGVPVSSLADAAWMLLASLIPGAAFVSVINDVTDRADDAVAGKRNRIAGRSGPFVALLLAVPIAIGVAIAFLWRHDALLVSCYLAAWLSFSLYSLPPFRFKTRGLLGVLVDASGAHLFPTLVAVVLAFRAAETAVRPVWVAAIAAWAFGYGVRGILWHQLTDRDDDRIAHVRTFAERHPPEVAARLGTFVAFPIELAALAAMLWLTRNVWPVAALAAYVLLSILRIVKWHRNAVIVVPQDRHFIALHEYYDAFLPLSLLVASSVAHGYDWIVLALHLLLFPRRFLRMMRDVWQLGFHAWRRVRSRATLHAR